MSWLLFMDESGHDHKTTPYEVRGGVAIHAGQLWPFIQAMQRLELDSFGAQLSLYQKELKGSTLLDRKRFRFANQDTLMENEARRKHCRAFLTKGLEKKTPTRLEFSAYELRRTGGRHLHLLRELGFPLGRHRHDRAKQAGDCATIRPVAQSASIPRAGLPRRQRI